VFFVEPGIGLAGQLAEACTMNFDEAFTALLGHEGGYSNNPADPGGETMWGVTWRVARANGYMGPMRDMPVEFAKGLYYARYWKSVRADELPTGVRFDAFDASVNSGPEQATKWLQEAVGAEVDGIIGPKTLAMLRTLQDGVTVARFNGYRLYAMTDMRGWPSFGKGWARRVANNLKGVGAA
jgi:lysozyme family protein